MINRVMETFEEAVADITDGAVIMIGNFAGPGGLPYYLIQALKKQGARRPSPAEKQIAAGEVELELVPQGTLAERIRCGAVGVPAFYTPTGFGTVIAEGKEVRYFDGRPHLLEHAIKADYAFVRAYKSDRMGNLVYRGTMRQFNPIMAMNARVTIAEVDEIVEIGEIDPEVVVTPGIFVNRIVRIEEDPGFPRHLDRSFWVRAQPLA